MELWLLLFFRVYITIMKKVWCLEFALKESRYREKWEAMFMKQD